MSQEDEFKSRAEALAARKIEHFLHPQQKDDESQTLETRIAKGIRHSDVIYNRTLRRWELIGHGRENLVGGLKEDPELTLAEFNKAFEAKINGQELQLNRYLEHSNYDGKYDIHNYKRYLGFLKILKRRYLKGNTITIAIPSLSYPPGDEKTVFISFSKPPFKVGS